MVLSAFIPYLTSVGNGAMWARFVDQTVDRSTACLLNDNITQVALHQVALIGLNFCFLDHLGYIGLASPLVGGLCLVPIFWVAICWGQQTCQEIVGGKCALADAFSEGRSRSVIRARTGLQWIMNANTYASITAAALFALSGYVVFSAVFGSLLLFSHFRRTGALSFRLSCGSEITEFLSANIAAVLIGAWYHRLRAVLDVSLRLRDYYKLSIRTEPIVPRNKLINNFSAKKVERLMDESSNGSGLIPTSEHLNWPGIELPDEKPAGIELSNYSDLAKEVCTDKHAEAMRSALLQYDDHYRATDFESDVVVSRYVNKKVGSWIQAVQKGNPRFPDQTARTERYILWIYSKIQGLDGETQAKTITQLTGSISESHDVCPEQVISIAEEVYLNLQNPDCKVAEQVVSFAAQGVRRHIFQQFLEGLKTKYPSWALNHEDRHLVSQLLSIINQKGVHLGLPEERTARSDRYYSGSFIEALLWFEARRFKSFFLSKYTAKEIFSSLRSTPWESILKDQFHEWLAPLDKRNDLTASVIRHVYNSTDEGALKEENLYGLLVHMGALTLPNEALSQLQGNELS